MRLLILYFFVSLSILSTTALVAQEDAALKHARELLKSTILVDGHNDLMWTIRESSGAPGDADAYDLSKPTDTDTDIPRLRQGLVGAQFWSVWIPADKRISRYARVQMEQIDLARRVIARYPETFTLALSADRIEQAHKNGRIASLIGMEGGHGLENSLSALRMYYTLGVRYMTLTHSVTLDWADAAGDVSRHDGLTAFGMEVVREMNWLGMLVDLSHASDKTMSDALDISRAPVIFSHSSARALTNHVRNVPDSILVRLRQNGGIVMITFIPDFVSQQAADWARERDAKKAVLSGQELKEYVRNNPKPQATISQVADHIEHVRQVSGIDHVGIGSDFFGSGDMPAGLQDVSRFPFLFAELVRRGWSDTDLKKLAGENFLRVLRQAEDVAARLQEERPASSRSIEEMDNNTANREKQL